MGINRWWVDLPDERYWIETTNRPDVGVDLHIPQADETGQPNWRYAMIKELSDGDVVFHYRKQEAAITAWSWAAGSVLEDDVLWAARGTSAQTRRVTEYLRPGWRRGLEGPFPLSAPVHLHDLAERAEPVRLLRNELRQRHGATYFPFALSDRRPPRPLQGYMFKLPAQFLDLFPVLKEAVPRDGAVTMPRPGRRVGSLEGHPIGQDYVHANEDSAISTLMPFDIDPAVADRGRRGHARTQTYQLSMSVAADIGRLAHPQKTHSSI